MDCVNTRLLNDYLARQDEYERELEMQEDMRSDARAAMVAGSGYYIGPRFLDMDDVFEQMWQNDDTAALFMEALKTAESDPTASARHLRECRDLAVEKVLDLVDWKEALIDSREGA